MDIEIFSHLQNMGNLDEVSDALVGLTDQNAQLSDRVKILKKK